MSHMLLSVAQIMVGAAILFASIKIAAHNFDRGTRASVRWPFVGMFGWAAWFGLQPLAGLHDSPPSIAFAALVAFALIRRQRQVLDCLGIESAEVPAIKWTSTKPDDREGVHS